MDMGYSTMKLDKDLENPRKERGRKEFAGWKELSNDFVIPVETS